MSLSDELRKAIGDEVQKLVQNPDKFSWNDLAADVQEKLLDAVLGRVPLSDELRASIKSVLKDGKVTKQEALEALRIWVNDQVGDDAVLQRAVELLASGALSKPDTSRAALEELLFLWLERQVKDPALIAFCGAARDQRPNSKAVWIGVKAALQAKHVDAKVIEALDLIVSGQTDELAELALNLVVGWASAVAGEEIGGILTKIVAGTAPEKAIEEVLTEWIRKQVPPEIVALFQKIEGEDWLGLLQLALSKLNLGDESDLILALVQGDGETALRILLKKALIAREVGEAGDIAEALLSLLQGKTKLFAEVDGDAGPFTGKNLARWRILRTCFIYAQALCNPNLLSVSTDLQARPLLLSVGDIRFDSELRALLPKNAGSAERRTYANALTVVVKVRFFDELTNTFLALGEDLVHPDFYGNIAIRRCKFAMDKLTDNLKEE
jgi:hypothetical protein